MNLKNIIAISFNLISFLTLSQVIKTDTLFCKTNIPIFAKQASHHLQTGDLDSLYITMDKWYNHCGFSEPLFRLNVLSSIYTSDLKEDKSTDLSFHFIENYDIRHEVSLEENYTKSYERYNSYFGFIPINDSFDIYTKELADSLLPKCKKGTIEYLYALLYSNLTDSFFITLQQDEYSLYQIHQQYDMEIEKIKATPWINASFGVHSLIPLSTKIGIQTGIHIEEGIFFQKNGFSIIIGTTFGKTKTDYLVKEKGTIHESNKYSPAYLGFKFYRNLNTSKRINLSWQTAAAWEILTYRKPKQPNDNTEIYGYSFQTGPVIRLFTSHQTNNISIQPSYKYISFTNNTNPHFQNHCINIELDYNFTINKTKNERFDQLRYQGKKF